jgi:mRNA-degrading endonuclease toxin of MazEF toxin-antitoxin module
MTLRRSRLRDRLGRLDDEDMVRLGRSVLVFLGFGGSTRDPGR